MKTKNLLTTLVLILLTTLTSFSQRIKGYTFKSYNVSYIESDFKELHESNELFQFSLTDGYLIHTVFNYDCTVRDAQVYKIKSHKTIDEDGILEVHVVVESGTSKKLYDYILHITEDYVILDLNNTRVLMLGYATVLKTYKQ
jgi:hypothetical protein